VKYLHVAPYDIGILLDDRQNETVHTSRDLSSAFVSSRAMTVDATSPLLTVLCRDRVHPI